MPNSKTLVLNHTQISQKITRIAHQIIENNFEEKELIVVGITPRGSELAKRICSILESIFDGTINYYDITLQKDNPLRNEIVCELKPEQAEGKTIILVDDVLNTGRALVFATRYLLGFDVKGMQTVTLIDRRHRNFPIRADYVGLTLATTMQEHILVEFGNEDNAWLV